MVSKAHKMNSVIEQVAANNNTSPKEVCKEMQIAINAARNNPNLEVQAYFSKLFGDSISTPEEFIKIAVEVMEKRDR